MDINTLLLAAAIIVTPLLWLAPIVLRRGDRRVVVRGLRNGLIVALIIFAIVAVVVGLLASGWQFFGQPLGIGPGLLVGVLSGVVAALAYLWLGSLLGAIGLIFRAKAGWVTAGAWAAVPIVIVSAGFGYGAFRSVSDEDARPASYPGTVALQLNGAKIGAISATGSAICQVNSAGDLSINAGGRGTTALTSGDGRPVEVGYTMNTDGAQVDVVVGDFRASPGKGWEATPDTVAAAPNSTPASGEAQLHGLVPLNATGEVDATERWSGQITWTCPGT